MSDTTGHQRLLKKAFVQVSKDPQEALLLFTQLLKDPELSDLYRSQAHIGRGLVYAQCYEEYDQTIKENDAAIQFNSVVQPSAFINRAQAFSYYGDNENAGRDYDEAVSRAPDWSEPFLHRAFFALEMKNFKLAISDFTEVIERDPDQSTAYFNRGYIYMNFMKDPTKALSDFNEAIRIDPKNGDMHSYRGFLYFECFKNLERAMLDFEESIKCKSANGYFWRSWIEAYVRKKDLQKALEDMNASISLDSFAVSMGRQKEAVESLAKGNRKETLSDYFFVKGLMLMKEEKWKEALECLEGVFKNHETRYRPLPALVLEDAEKRITELKKIMENLSHHS